MLFVHVCPALVCGVRSVVWNTAVCCACVCVIVSGAMDYCSGNSVTAVKAH